jgi:signal transduction histidine kinase
MSGSTAPTQPLLSLTVHELRTPLTIVSGYIRMLLGEKAGPLSEPQRRLLAEAEKSCGRLSALVAELGELSGLEGGSTRLALADIPVADLLQELAAHPPAVPDRQVSVRLVGELKNGETVHGDRARLRQSLGAIIAAIARETIDTDDLVLSHRLIDRSAGRTAQLRIGAAGVVDRLDSAAREDLAPFDELRGGCGLALPIARRVLEAHGGTLGSLAGSQGRASAWVELPLKR